jgi:two-component system LytT family response regulator
MIKAIIVDDESKGIQILRILIKNHCPDVEVIGWAEDVDEAIELITRMEPELVFLDIEMAGEGGFSLLEKIGQRNFHVVFVTAHSQYAVKAFRYSVADYLLKPVYVVELKQAIEKVKLLMQEQKVMSPDENVETTLRIPLHQGAVFVKMHDIIRLEADGAYTRIFLSGKRTYLTSYNIKIFSEHLDMNLFMRIHRSHIINLNKIKKVISDGKHVEMTDDSAVKISRRIRCNFLTFYKKEFKCDDATHTPGILHSPRLQKKE